MSILLNEHYSPPIVRPRIVVPRRRVRGRGLWDPYMRQATRIPKIIGTLPDIPSELDQYLRSRGGRKRRVRGGIGASAYLGADGNVHFGGQGRRRKRGKKSRKH